MPWAPDYVTSAELKSYLRITDTVDDAEIAFAVTAASRIIDQWCNRQFGSAAAVTRYYTADYRYIDGRLALEVDDLVSLTSVVVKDSSGNTVATLTSASWDLWPWNAAANGQPYTHVVLKPTASATFTSEARSNEVTGTFGWSSVPTIVKQAALIQASRFFARRNSPYGIAGSAELGNEIRLLARIDADVAVALQSVRRHWGAV